jgi:hypothetical protein
MRVTLLNLTPHPLVLFLENGETREIPPADQPARVVDRRHPARRLEAHVGALNVVDVEPEGTVVGMPPRREGVVLVVSRVTALAVDRPDVVFPLDEVRDEAGRIVGCRALGRFVEL